MAGVWKRDGTVAVTNGNKKVTGTGTTFADTKNGVAKGHLFCITSGTSVDFYEVDYVVSNTELYLVQAYRGVTATGKAYEIITTFSDSVPEFARRLTATLSAYQQQSDAFQALLTSTATTVEVTAPDGTKQTLIPWKRVSSEGEGQAARAKTEADKAAASAALAGDIVVASALPLPDVWAPLSDSLRLITGYGREVKVDEDVVARMVNFSRSTTATYIGKDGQLKTAAVNEPRFEKEGLLIEGQSTNLTTWSEGWPASAGATAGNAWSHTSKDAAGWITVSGGTDAGSPEGSYRDFVVGATIQGKTTTFSFDVKKVAGYKFQVSVFIEGAGSDGFGMGSASFVDGQAFPSTPGLTVKDMGTWLRISITRKFGDDLSIIRLYPFGMAPGSNGALTYRRVQVEALPFATSYIPTNGAAVTRVADVCWLPVENSGLPGIDNEKTMALTSDILGVNDAFNFIVATPWGAIDYTPTNERVSGNAIALNMNTPVALKTSVRKVARFAKGGGCAAIFGDIQKTDPTADWSLSTSRIVIGSLNESGAYPHFGHVKDLKIWLKPLSDAQMKAIA